MKRFLVFLFFVWVMGLPACKNAGTGPSDLSAINRTTATPTPVPTLIWTPGSAGSAFIITDVSLRDPHTTTKMGLCVDFTDALIGNFSTNGAVRSALRSDTNSDGRLDDSLLLLFKPNGSLDLMFEPYCTAPMSSTACHQASARVFPTTYETVPPGEMLSVLSGTVHPYQPAVSVPSAPGFSSGTLSTVVNFCGNAITLMDVTVAGTFVGAPPVSITNGLVRGFLPEANADAIHLPATMPVVGGQTLSAFLPGGQGNCSSTSDKDTDRGVAGWWIYVNFTAAQVPYSTP